MNIKPDYYEIIGYFDHIESMRKKVNLIPENDWLQFKDRKIINGSQADTIPIYNIPDKNNLVFHSKIFNEKYISLFKDELFQIYSIVKRKYSGDATRCMLVRLSSKKYIIPHSETDYYSCITRRIHVPIFTHEDYKFIVDDMRVRLNIGEVISINNYKNHYGINYSNIDRIHLIFDWGDVNDTYFT